MFTPEFVMPEHGEYVLVASHSLMTAEARRLSIEFNRARIAFAATQLPSQIARCRLVIDVRGQNLAASTLLEVRTALEGFCTLEFRQS
jgi:hypothetical protein